MSDVRDHDPASDKSSWHPRRVLSYILTLMVAIFVFQNLAAVDVDFLFWTMRLPTAILIIFVFLVGAFVGFVFHQNFARR